MQGLALVRYAFGLWEGDFGISPFLSDEIHPGSLIRFALGNDCTVATILSVLQLSEDM